MIPTEPNQSPFVEIEEFAEPTNLEEFFALEPAQRMTLFYRKEPWMESVETDELIDGLNRFSGPGKPEMFSALRGRCTDSTYSNNMTFKACLSETKPEAIVAFHSVLNEESDDFPKQTLAIIHKHDAILTESHLQTMYSRFLNFEVQDWLIVQQSKHRKGSKHWNAISEILEAKPAG
ncbi:MAG: hypothetical protein KDC26_00685 [Armatimonadetes bacterium]|nr:hypothetical protein [Armatimonadota bacterium]